MVARMNRRERAESILEAMLMTTGLSQQEIRERYVADRDTDNRKECLSMPYEKGTRAIELRDKVMEEVGLDALEASQGILESRNLVEWDREQYEAEYAEVNYRRIVRDYMERADAGVFDTGMELFLASEATDTGWDSCLIAFRRWAGVEVGLEIPGKVDKE